MQATRNSPYSSQAVSRLLPFAVFIAFIMISWFRTRSTSSAPILYCDHGYERYCVQPLPQPNGRVSAAWLAARANGAGDLVDFVELYHHHVALRLDGHAS